MNNNDHYERHEDRALPEQPTPQPQTLDAVNALALHRDPSVPVAKEPTEPTAQRGIAWVRPSELPTLVGSKLANRGIDLQSELVRRSRRAPVKAAKAGRRISRTAISRPERVTRTVGSTEELGL